MWSSRSRISPSIFLADKYAAAFANAGIGDDDLNRARGDADAVAHIIQAVSLRGGSATIFKRKLMQPVLPKEAAPVKRQHQQPRRKPPSQTNPSGGAAEEGSSKPSQRQLTANADGLFKLASEADLALMLERTPTVVVEFKARWCGGCKKFAPTYTKLATELDSAAASLCVMDVDDAAETAMTYGASELPHFVIFRSGQRWDQLVGGKLTTLKQKIRYSMEGKRYNSK